MLRFTFISLALLICAANANLFENTEKGVLPVSDTNEQEQSNAAEPSEETGLAVINNDTPIASAMDDLVSEGQSNGVVIRAKRYYGCGCGCCGCATVDPTATVAACGCGCCGCGYG
ncbi:hypothetical protein CAEBREN_02082 [Caenorhabditis brenneri]|uniref:Uncharacterized protein n=1 Tax=Caenorhabditis brenneri TaxID=135651 RepID=G0NF51_CAEBE|nr:hypothetical protein CAEBREN_02082 [Caenorhabditis brenneri]